MSGIHWEWLNPPSTWNAAFGDINTVVCSTGMMIGSTSDLTLDKLFKTFIQRKKRHHEEWYLFCLFVSLTQSFSWPSSSSLMMKMIGNNCNNSLVVSLSFESRWSVCLWTGLLLAFEEEPIQLECLFVQNFSSLYLLCFYSKRPSVQDSFLKFPLMKESFSLLHFKWLIVRRETWSSYKSSILLLLFFQKLGVSWLLRRATKKCSKRKRERERDCK